MLLFGKYPYLTPVSITSNEAYFISESLNMRRKLTKQEAQRFEFGITVEQGLGSSLHADLMTHWLEHGMDKAFLIDVPQHLFTERETSSRSPISVQAAYPGGAKDIIVIGSQSSFKIAPGRFLTFSNHYKLYAARNGIVSSYSSSTGLHTASLNISPGLTEPVPKDTQVEINDVKAFVLNEADNATLNYEGGVIQKASLRFVEYLL